MGFIIKSVVLLGQNICKGEKMIDTNDNKKEEKGLELDDLLISDIQEEDEKETKSKKTILLVAIGIVIFAIIILIVYMMQSGSKNEVDTNAQTNKPVEEAQLPTMAKEEQNTDFGQVPIQSQNTSNSDEQFQKIIDQIKAQQKEQQEALPNPPKEQVALETNQENKQNTIKSSETKNATTTTAEDSKKQEVGIAKGFYIQVGSFSKSPNQKILQTIKELNFSHQMQKAGSATRLLIGPFATKEEAQKNLPVIKDKINKDAFIKEIK